MKAANGVEEVVAVAAEEQGGEEEEVVMVVPDDEPVSHEEASQNVANGEKAPVDTDPLNLPPHGTEVRFAFSWLHLLDSCIDVVVTVGALYTGLGQM